MSLLMSLPLPLCSRAPGCCEPRVLSDTLGGAGLVTNRVSNYTRSLFKSKQATAELVTPCSRCM